MIELETLSVPPEADSSPVPAKLIGALIVPAAAEHTIGGRGERAGTVDRAAGNLIEGSDGIAAAIETHKSPSGNVDRGGSAESERRIGNHLTVGT